MAQAYVEIPLSGERGAGHFALIDIDDYETVIEHRWWMAGGKYPYAVTDVQKNRVKRRIYMHALITGFRKTDHQDLDELNNRRYNLRDGSEGRNERNQRAQRSRSSRYKGVWRHSSKGVRWAAGIQVDGAKHYLGVFKEEEAAARAYDAAAREHFGEYAWLNFPGDQDGRPWHTGQVSPIA